jgi:hypothetical protein
MVVGLGTANPKLRAVLRMNTDKFRWSLCSPSDAVCDECLLDLLPNAHDGAGVVTLLQQGVHVHNDLHTEKVRHGNCSCERTGSFRGGTANGKDSCGSLQFLQAVQCFSTCVASGTKSTVSQLSDLVTV